MSGLRSTLRRRSSRPPRPNGILAPCSGQGKCLVFDRNGPQSGRSPASDGAGRSVRAPSTTVGPRKRRPAPRRPARLTKSCVSAISSLSRVGLKVPVRDFAAIAGVGLANVVAGLDQDKWHAHNLDQALRGVAVATGVAGALQVTARRVARLEYAVHSAPLLRLLGRVLDDLKAEVPPPQPSFDELLDRLSDGLRRVAELLRDRYPRLCRNHEIEGAYGGATKARGVVGMLRKRGGLVIQNRAEAVSHPCAWAECQRELVLRSPWPCRGPSCVRPPPWCLRTTRVCPVPASVAETVRRW